MMLSLILGGVALVTAADLPQAPKTIDLSGFQKLTDQETQEIRGTGIVYGPQNIARMSNQFQKNINPSATMLQQQDQTRQSCPKP